MSERELKEVVVYTDGACIGNPGAGGYGVVLTYGKLRKELSGGLSPRTNNRMELLAAIVALEALKEPCRVRLHSDSQYLIKPLVERKAQRWQSNGWVRSRAAMKPVKNADLWQRLLDATARHEVEYFWVRGHAGIVENERCDELSVQAAKSNNLPIDPGFTPKPPDTVVADTQAAADLPGRVCRKCATPLIRK